MRGDEDRGNTKKEEGDEQGGIQKDCQRCENAAFSAPLRLKIKNQTD